MNHNRNNNNSDNINTQQQQQQPAETIKTKQRSKYTINIHARTYAQNTNQPNTHIYIHPLTSVQNNLRFIFVRPFVTREWAESW